MAQTNFKVFVDDNFHFMDESERYCAGEFETAEAAIEFARRMVDENLDHLVQEAIRQGASSADDLFRHYTSFGQDPFITNSEEKVEFSAWSYANQRCLDFWAAKEKEQVYEEPEWPYEKAFPFRPEERFLKYELLAFVDRLIAERPWSPLQLKNLAILKYGLRLLPKTPVGIHIGLGIVLDNGGESTYCDLFVSENRLSVSRGGYVRGPMGGDSYTETLFECELHGFREGVLDAWTLGGWELEAQELLNLGARLSFENVTDEAAVDWEEGSECDSWDEFDEKVRRWIEAGGDLD